jgi:hypothetical protein
MTGPRPFGPDELDGVAGLTPDELAAETRLARDLEGIAARDGIRRSPDFADRVMGAIALEPVPAPVVAAGSALRHAALLGFLVSIRDAFRVTFSGGFPVAVRAQAFALVLLVVGLTAGSGYAAAGALGLLDRSTPSPVVEVPTTPAETAAPTATPEATSEAPTPSASPEPSEGAEPSEAPEASEDPSETPEATDGGSSTTAPAATSRPTAKPTPRPKRTPEATDDHGGDDGGEEGDDSGKGGGNPSDDPDDSGHGGND